ncbi:hypothetical protein POM88_011015 [Heracleum sosnowskyi]|uniref:Uncharacterized protein n=1 Tax=Heracleum sosnowskyi TaxID=360622 RepID=A0AAD8ITR4_9APIA|nr:hypothetical protein POM88_011015 [Heracleum sosnowskyi]
MPTPNIARAANVVASGEVSYSHFIFRFDFKDWKCTENFQCSNKNKIMSTPPTIIIEPGINEVPMPIPVPRVVIGTSVDGHMTEGQETEPQVSQPRPTRKRGLRLDTFKRCVEIEKIKSKFLPSMESSIDFEKAFERLEEEDKGFKAYFEKKTRGPTKKEDWVAVRML